MEKRSGNCSKVGSKSAVYSGYRACALKHVPNTPKTTGHRISSHLNMANKQTHPAPATAVFAALLMAAILLSGAVTVSVSGAERVRRIELDNGDVYEGPIVDDQRSGQGSYEWQDGRRFEGTFANDRMQGQGTYSWPDGRTYTGEFNAGQREGKGTLAWPNGDTYTGDFLADQRTGKGTLRWANNDIYEGDFVEGKRTGSGTLRWHTGEVYTGQISDGSPNGFGVFTYLDERRYEGQFEGGKKHGDGQLSWSNGNRYVGRFENDVRTGLGKFYWRDGTVYRGQFANDKMDGYGIKDQADGSDVFQIWQEGELYQTLTLLEEPRCQMQLQDKRWMFHSDSCINGRAHGRGTAVSLDGQQVIRDAYLILGNLIAGEYIDLQIADG